MSNWLGDILEIVVEVVVYLFVDSRFDTGPRVRFPHILFALAAIAFLLAFLCFDPGSTWRRNFVIAGIGLSVCFIILWTIERVHARR